MLVLSRRRDSSIEIGADVKITVLEIRKGRVKLGILAPTSMAVRRGEGPPVCRHEVHAVAGVSPSATAGTS